MRTSRLALCIGLPAVAAAAILGSGAVAQGPSSGILTLTELDRGSTFTHIRNTKTTLPRSNALGDLIVFTNPLADASGQVVGRLHVDCVTTTGARDFRKSVLTCGGVMVLRDGTLTLQTTVSPSTPTTTGAITGGTGAYANARGVVVSKESGRNSVDTITLAP
jgi:Dirigent-like protein